VLAKALEAVGNNSGNMRCRFAVSTLQFVKVEIDDSSAHHARTWVEAVGKLEVSMQVLESLKNAQCHLLRLHKLQ
jgi:hypothetical protein